MSLGSARGSRGANSGVALATAAVMAALIAVYLAHKFGPGAGLGALAGVAGCLLLLERPKLSLLLFFGVGIVAEDDPTWGINLSSIYNHGTALPSPFEALEVLAFIAVLLGLLGRRQRPQLPRPFMPAFGLTLAAILAGLVTGFSSGIHSPSAFLSPIETLLPVLLMPWMIVNTVRTPGELRRALAIGLGLGVFKAIAGLFVYFAGLAPPQPGFGRLTYYLPTANLLMMLFLLGMLVAALSRTPVPRWARWAAPLVFLAFLLSFRRTQWLGSVAAALALLLPASGRVGRRFVVPVVGAIGVIGYLILATGLGGGLQGPILKRVESINASQISQNDQDRYRIDERHNVWAAVQRQPLSGLGFGVQWPTRYPLGFDFPNSHLYVHIGALWWWMKMGVLGLLAYASILGLTLRTGLAIWRRHSDSQVRVFGLAACGLTIGLVIVELASSAMGVNERTSVFFGAVLGLLAVAHSQLSPQPDSMAGAVSGVRLSKVSQR